MTDPMHALNGLQEAIDVGVVSLEQFQPCELHPELCVMLDEPAPQVTRFTYAKFEATSNGAIVQAIALFIVTEPINGVLCFQAGYAVAGPVRRQGLGSRVVQAGIDELKNGMGRTPIKEFYVEAVVGVDNVASNKIASATISAKPEPIADALSGESALQYLRKVQVQA